MRVHDFLDYQARQHPDTDFAICGDRRVSFRQAHREANQLARAFAAEGLGRGDRVAILSKNSIELALLYYGAFKAGVVAVPLNYRLTPREWAFVLNDAEARIVVAEEPFVAGIEAVRDELDAGTQFLVAGEPAQPGWEGLEGWAARQPPDQCAFEVGDGEDALQMYTSGTTGRPKGAVLTHRAVTANITQFAPEARLCPGERFLIVAPLYHAAATVSMLHCVACGGTLYIQPGFSPVEVVRALSEECIVGTMLVPAMLQACLVEVPQVAGRSYADLRLITYGASPIAAPTLRRAMEVFRCDFAQRYGSTETLVLTWLSPADHKRALTDKPELLLSAGRTLLGTELRVVDERGRPVPSGVIGEFVVRGPQLMRGYWNQAEATREAFRDGWMHTGDAGVVDDEGYVYIQDRVVDMIVSGGENVYPREVEEVLLQHPAVAHAAVIGVPDTRWGEAVQAFVVLEEGASATEESIVKFCRERLAGFKLPRSVAFRGELPRNHSGKVLRRELREAYWKGCDRNVS